MRFEERVMHLVELALLTRELSGAKRAAGVDYHVALPHHEARLFRDFPEAASYLRGTSTSEIGLEGNALDRRLWMQLEWQPRQIYEAFSLQALDSDRVDIAPGSNVV
jgi:hypothetical protein